MTPSFTLLFVISSHGSADQWRFDKERKEEQFVFGDTKIVRVIDTTDNVKYPDYAVYIYSKDELTALYRGVSFEFIYADKYNKTFVGLSNSGLPGNAMMIFDSEDRLGDVWNHERFVPDYCDRSVTISKVWVDEVDPKLEFTYGSVGDGYDYIKDITYVNCHGKRVSLNDTYIEGIERKVTEHKAFEKEYREYLSRKKRAEVE